MTLVAGTQNASRPLNPSRCHLHHLQRLQQRVHGERRGSRGARRTLDVERELCSGAVRAEPYLYTAQWFHIYSRGRGGGGFHTSGLSTRPVANWNASKSVADLIETATDFCAFVVVPMPLLVAGFCMPAIGLCVAYASSDLHVSFWPSVMRGHPITSSMNLYKVGWAP